MVSPAHADGPGPLADPKSDKQVGFPTDLYSWVIPPDNPQTPEKIALGKALFFDDRLSADGKISCDHCHGPAKYQVQLQRVALLRDMIDWCIENPVKGKAFNPNDPKLRALEAYIYAQRKGIALDYGKH